MSAPQRLRLAVLFLLLALVVGAGYLTYGLASTVLTTMSVSVAPGALLLNLGVAATALVVALARLARRDLSPPTSFRAFAAAVLGTYARGWFIGCGLLVVRELWDEALVFGSPPENGSYIADAFFFAVTVLALAIPGVIAFVAARVAAPRRGM